MIIEPWVIWIAIGVICIITEMFTPTFFFMSIGLGAIIAGIAAFVTDSITAQIIVFVVVTFTSFISLSKLSKKLFKSGKEETNIFAIIGMTGTVTKEIIPGSKGYVKIRGEEWAAESEDNESLPANMPVIVTSIKGNKAIVKKKSS